MTGATNRALAVVGAVALALGVAGGAPADPPVRPSKPLSKTEMKKFAKALGWWLLFGDEAATRESDKRTKKLAELQKFEQRTWKGVREKWNGWISGQIPHKRKSKTELAWQYTEDKWPKNHIVWRGAKGYRPGRPTPLVCALHGGGRGVGNGNQAMGGYGGAFAGKGCHVFAPTVPGPEYVFAHPMSEQFVRHFIHEISREVSIDFDRIYVVGHSLGGVGAWAFGARMPDFWAATVSGAGNPPGIVNDDYSDLYNTPLFIHHSTTDIQVPPSWNQAAEKHIQALDPPLRDCQFHWYEAGDGRGHGYPPSIPAKYEPWVMEQVRDMYPERVVAMCPIARSKDDHGYVDYPGDETAIDTFWVGIRNRTGDVAKVVAKVVGPNHIEATTSGVGQLVIYVSDEYLDLDQPVKVVVNGSEAHNAIVPRSAEFLCKHIEACDDRGRFFSGEIVLAGDGGAGSSGGGGGYWDDDDDDDEDED